MNGSKVSGWALLFFGGVLAAAAGCVGGSDEQAADPTEDEINAATFACGSTRCKARTQFCELRSGGAHRIGGGSSQSSSCKALPNDAECRRSPSCLACGLSTAGLAMRCGASNGNVTVIMMMP